MITSKSLLWCCRSNAIWKLVVQEVKLEHLRAFGTVFDLSNHSLAQASLSSGREYLRLAVKQMSYEGRAPRL